MSCSLGDRNLLLGILALQNGFVSEAALLAAIKVWVLDKSKGLTQILRDQHALSENHHALLEEAVDSHLARHGHDGAKSLAAVCLAGPIRHDLEKIVDPDVQASLARVSTAASVPNLALLKPWAKDKPSGVPAWRSEERRVG